MCCSEKVEALFVTSDVSNHALPICMPMYFLPSAIWEQVPRLSVAMVIPCFLHCSGPSGTSCWILYKVEQAPSVLSENWVQVDQTYGVSGTRKIKKSITLGYAVQILTQNLVKQRDEFKYLRSNFLHSWFCGKMVVTTFKNIWGNGTRRMEQGNETKLNMKSTSFFDDGHQIYSISQWQRLCSSEEYSSNLGFLSRGLGAKWSEVIKLPLSLGPANTECSE